MVFTIWSFWAFNNFNKNTIYLLFKFDTDTIFKFKPDTLVTNIVNSGNSSLMTLATEITDGQMAYFIKHKIIATRLALLSDGNGVDLDGNYMLPKTTKQLKKSAMYMLGVKEISDQ